MNKQPNQSADDPQKEIRSTHVQVVDIKIEAYTAEDVLKVIAAELEKSRHLHHFSGYFLGFVRTSPIVSFGTIQKRLESIHEDLCNQGECNVYFIKEDIKTGNTCTYVYTNDKEISEAERASFKDVLCKIESYILKRTEDFKDEKP